MIGRVNTVVFYSAHNGDRYLTRIMPIDACVVDGDREIDIGFYGNEHAHTSVNKACMLLKKYGMNDKSVAVSANLYSESVQGDFSLYAFASAYSAYKRKPIDQKKGIIGVLDARGAVLPGMSVQNLDSALREFENNGFSHVLVSRTAANELDQQRYKLKITPVGDTDDVIRELGI